MGMSQNQGQDYITLYNDPTKYVGAVDPNMESYDWKGVSPAFGRIKNRNVNVRYDARTGKVLGYYDGDRQIAEQDYDKYGFDSKVRQNGLYALQQNVRYRQPVQQNRRGGVIDYWGVY